MGAVRLAAVGWILLLVSSAAAQPVRLRFATMAPEGSAWARDMRAFSRDLAASTGGHVQSKWYLGGITGDEFATLERLRRGQIDGAGLTIACEQLAPSLRVLRIVGLIQSRAESRHLIARLMPRLEKEFTQHGFVSFGVGNFGQIILFTRRPVRRFVELRAQRLWVWDKDELWIRLLKQAGLNPVALPVEDAGRAFDDDRVDGFLAVPGAALVFQWTTQAHFFSDLHLGLLPDCFVMTQQSYDALSLEEQAALRQVGARFAERFEEEGAHMDAQLTSGLLEHQGLRRVPTDEALLAEFFESAQKARATVPADAVPPELLSQVMGWLADYRAEHARPRR